VRACLIVEAFLAAGVLGGLGFGDLDVVIGRRGGEFSGQQEVAREAVGDILDVTGTGGALYFLEEYDLHGDLLG
jgi:hypothetical protein